VAKINRCTPDGIGYVVAKDFYLRGFHVIATDRTPALLVELRRLEMDAIALDVTDAISIRLCRQEVEKLHDGQLEILVNNACVLRRF
jgi:1-acylglycerone phosphate reductase